MKRKFFSRFKEVFPLPNLIENQVSSFNSFLEVGMKEVFKEISPILDYSDSYELHFLDFSWDEPKYDAETAKQKNVTYEAPLKAMVKLKGISKDSKIKSLKQEVYLGDFPLITDRGTFIINGIERVVISQLIRSPGVFFSTSRTGTFSAKIIPSRGAWLEFERDKNGAIWIKIDRKRKVAATSLLRAFGGFTDQKLIGTFGNDIKATIDKDIAKSADQGYVEIYRRLRPGDMATPDNAKSLVDAMFFSDERYDFGKVGRFKFNQRMNLPDKVNDKTLRVEDLELVTKELLANKGPRPGVDDIDHLGNRRIKTVGELVESRFRIGLARMKRNIRDKMNMIDPDSVQISQLVNSRPLSSAVREFFASSQLSQFMDQVNTLAELEHKRRLSAMGPGGLVRERAGFEVRDVHSSHYGRICPIQSSEGPNIGLVVYLASFAKINELGFLETPYRKVKNGVVTKEIVYLNAFAEEGCNIANAGEEVDDSGRLKSKRVSARIKGKPGIIARSKVDLIDVSPKQAISISTSLIPFLEHDDAQRALMGSNMQRQAIPSVIPESPVVGTGVEERAARDSKQIVLAQTDGIVSEVDSAKIVVGKDTYHLDKFVRSNTDSALNHRPLVEKGQKVKKGGVVGDGGSTEDGEIALGQNILVAFMPWEGWNFEDAIVISESLLKNDRYSSVHIEEFSLDVRETKLGPEVTTCDIPNVSEDKLRNLDAEGIIRIGAEVASRDILVGKISPKGEQDLSAEERLLRAIFGEKARDVKDSSLLMPHGKRGKVVDVKIFSREQGDRLPSGVIRSIQIRVAQFRRISVGDKLAGRHGNKGVVSKILPEEDMPYLPDGRPVEMILNPLGVISRMNIGQIMETHLGWAASTLGYKVATPPLSGATEKNIKEELEKANLPLDGRVQLIDGRSGEAFDNPTTVGIMYVMKLNHLVEDKIHMRSTGPYSLITQQPLGGKAQFGGQRFGEMEVWALEGYGASHTLQEMLTIKSDDVQGRSKAYESIIKGVKIPKPNIPASFHLLMQELKALGLSVELK